MLVYKQKKEKLEADLKECEAQQLELQSFKYYGKCDGVTVRQKPSNFVNRYINRAELAE